MIIDAISTDRIPSPAARRFADWVDTALPLEISRAKTRLPKEELNALAEAWEPPPPQTDG